MKADAAASEALQLWKSEMTESSGHAASGAALPILFVEAYSLVRQRHAAIGSSDEIGMGGDYGALAPLQPTHGQTTRPKHTPSADP
mgnify:CR=1 FL=1